MRHGYQTSQGDDAVDIHPCNGSMIRPQPKYLFEEEIVNLVIMGELVSGNKSLHQAAFYNDLRTVKVLLCLADDDVNVLNDKEQTPIHIAASKGFFDIVNYLISCKANLKLRDIHGRSIYYFAQANGHREVADLILKQFAHPQGIITPNKSFPTHSDPHAPRPFRPGGWS